MKKTHFMKKFAYLFTFIFLLSMVFHIPVLAETSLDQKTTLILLTDATVDTEYEFTLKPMLTPVEGGNITWTEEKDLSLEQLKEQFPFVSEFDETFFGLPEGLHLDPTGILSGKPTKAEMRYFLLTEDNGSEKISHLIQLTICAKSDEPEQPIEPDKPTEPEQPIEPDKPTEPDKPIEPDKPTEPEQPSEPDKPVDPEPPETPAQLEIKTTILEDAVATEAYSMELETNSTEEVLWELKKDHILPEGLLLKGNLITGTPKTAGKFQFTLIAKTQTSEASKDFTLTVKPASKYTVNISSTKNGSASANFQEAEAGTEIKLSAKANKGYRFKNWNVTKGKVTIKNNCFIMPKENVTIEAVFEKIPFNAKFTKGEKQVYKINTDKSLVFSTTGERTKLKSVYIDKNWISAENFDITSKENTILTLHAKYLDTLKPGTHTLTLKYEDGSISTTFKVTEGGSPQTGDSSSVSLWLITMSVAILLIIAALIYKRRFLK